jgi:hypothetical protein
VLPKTDVAPVGWSDLVEAHKRKRPARRPRTARSPDPAQLQAPPTAKPRQGPLLLSRSHDTATAAAPSTSRDEHQAQPKHREHASSADHARLRFLWT